MDQVLLLGGGLVLMLLGIAALFASRNEGRSSRAIQEQGIDGVAHIVREDTFEGKRDYKVVVIFEYTPPGSTQVYQHQEIISETLLQARRGADRTLPIVYLPDNPDIVAIRGLGLDGGVATDPILMGTFMIFAGFIMMLFGLPG